jgi:hypothetical protein
MLRKMTPSEQDPPAVAAAEPTRAGGQVVAVAVALLEAAALIAAMRRLASWNPLLPLYAAADRMWTGSEPCHAPSGRPRLSACRS